MLTLEQTVEKLRTALKELHWETDPDVREAMSDALTALTEAQQREIALLERERVALLRGMDLEAEVARLTAELEGARCFHCGEGNPVVPVEKERP